MTPPELERLVQIGTLNSTLSDLASSVRWPSSPQPSSPILPPDLTGEEGEIRSKMGSGGLSLPSGRGGGREREGWESEGLPKEQHSPAGCNETSSRRAELRQSCARGAPKLSLRHGSAIVFPGSIKKRNS